MGDHHESKGQRPERGGNTPSEGGKLSPERLARRKDALEGLAALRRKIGPTNVDVRALIDEGRR